jgi:hypothetical protein
VRDDTHLLRVGDHHLLRVRGDDSCNGRCIAGRGLWSCSRR